MRIARQTRGPLTILTIGLVSNWSIPAAFAACGMAAVGGGASGPPSISTTETSTTQVLEQIRRRTQAAQEAQVIPASTTAAAPAAAAPPPPAAQSAPPAAAASSQAAASSASSNAAATAAAVAQPKPAPKPATPAAAPVQAAAVAKPKPVQAAQSAPAPKPVKAAEPAPTSAAPSVKVASRASLKDDYGIIEETSVAGGVSRVSAVWAQSYLAYDRHRNIAPGNQENPTRSQLSGGGLLGADWTHLNHGRGGEALQVGVFTGYNQTSAKHSDTFFFTDEVGNDGVADTNYFRQNYREDIDGPFVGAYMAYARDKWTFDAAFKADFYDIDQSSDLAQRCGNDFGRQVGSATVNNYMVAGNIAHRHDLSERSWLEPVVGLRYTYTDFGNDVSNSAFNFGGVQPTGTLGLADGSALRLQGGLRYGERGETREGYLWTVTLGAFLYSDVVITGFESVAGQTGEPVGPVDEGKLRALGQFEAKLNTNNGYTYMLQLEARGGDDVFGAAGQVGVRYEW